ncbi:predicted protein [Sclerotinia sclerotiorum 1980 UF-70]|uniref:Uncharacterized protein n=1 Tax=Sclerotinia sclerotiorum (strain ATCC 18683 / 1980 / Ss-1) TaxID=665079 RepID=A7E7Q7_SCLS1|nr:predicted protein [Sclerotinia sclerotiorum 1980 UF-70]EDN96409.1 predicted protein [Sclerotinia sclerotiorum 1980 UF-70]
MSYLFDKYPKATQQCTKMTTITAKRRGKPFKSISRSKTLLIECQ